VEKDGVQWSKEAQRIIEARFNAAKDRLIEQAKQNQQWRTIG
jgi:hypothetical protein